ncbi:MAG: serine hydrolase [Planctomycetes bacterium]|nr:serine hydrolase [Planctomycetota bacterium]MBI3835559.1 serine hydrolase [Planctomycetota bacterium]
MKNRQFAMFVRLIIFIALIGLHETAVAEPAPTDLQQALNKLLDQYHAPALAAAAVRDGKLVAIGVDGVRELDGKDKAVITDRSMIGSCGKAATRLLIGRLVDKGKLRWDSTLAELLPDVNMLDEYRSVTVGDVIGHRAGLQPYTEISSKRTPILFEQSGAGPREQRATFIAHLLIEPPSAPPKSKFIYSNAGYGLLGHIAERLMDQSYEKLMRDEVFRPLGMTSATIGTPLEVSSLAGWTGHMRTPSGMQAVKPGRPGLPAIAPAGLMSMSIEDFAKLSTALVNVEAGKVTDFLSKTAIEKLPELRPGAKGSEGEVFLGGDGHYTAAFALWPSRGLSIVVESNAGDSDSLCQATVKAVRELVAADVPSQDTQSAGGEKPRRYGFRIKAEGDDDTWLVADVDDNSVAAKAGLHANDKITAINGEALSAIPLDDRMGRVKQSPLKLRVERDGKPIDIEMRLP